MEINHDKIRDTVKDAVAEQAQKSIEKEAKLKEFREACAGFESMFISQLVTQMRKSIPKSDFLGKGKGEEMVEGLMNDEYAKAMAQSSGIGLANILYNQLKETIE
ncbi:MAG: rod-binding protein [Armatimonadota bacterium]